MRGSRLILFCCSCIFFFSFFYVYAQSADKVKNKRPKVEILTPANAGSFDWNSFIHYSIRVTDAEDGNSEYAEIPEKEVFLEVIYIPGGSKITEKKTA